MESAKSKRKSIQLSEKFAIIHENENGKKQVEVIKERKLAQSTVQDIWKNRTKILQNYLEFSPGSKQARKTSFSLVDTALIQWLDIQRKTI